MSCISPFVICNWPSCVTVFLTTYLLRHLVVQMAYVFGAKYFFKFDFFLLLDYCNEIICVCRQLKHGWQRRPNWTFNWLVMCRAQTQRRPRAIESPEHRRHNRIQFWPPSASAIEHPTKWLLQQLRQRFRIRFRGKLTANTNTTPSKKNNPKSIICYFLFVTFLQNSVSDASGSCSYSSSDTDSSSSSQVSTSSSVPPQFSVTSSQTGGLRLTIATVRKSCSSPTQKDESNEQATTENDEPPPQQQEQQQQQHQHHQAIAKDPENSISSVIKNLPNPKLSCSDSDSDSDSGTSSNSESRLTVKSNASDKKQMVKRDSPAGRAKCLRKTTKSSLNVKQSESKTNCAKRTVRSNKDGNLRVSPRCPPTKNQRRTTRTNKVRYLFFRGLSRGKGSILL